MSTALGRLRRNLSMDFLSSSVHAKMYECRFMKFLPPWSEPVAVDHSIPAMAGRAPARVPDLCFSNRCLITLRMRVIDEQFSVKYWNENTTGYCRLIRCNGQIKRSRNKSWNIEGEWKRDPLLWHTDRIQSVLTCTVFTYHSDNFVAMIFDISKYDRGAIWNC